MSVGYGSDTYCYDQIFTGRLSSGADVVAQAVFRRLSTPRGMLRDGDEGSVYGFDVLDFVGRVGTKESLDALPDAVRAEVLKDDRIDTCDVNATITQSTDGLIRIRLDIIGTLHDSNDTFTLTLSVDDVSVSVLQVLS